MAINSISFSSGMRNSLTALYDSNVAMQRVQQRLATGKKVNSPLDNPTSFFAATSHANRAAAFLSRKDSINEAVQIIRAATNGISATTSMLDTMHGLASAALSTTDQSERSSLAASYYELQKQITAAANDSSYRNTNLLSLQNLEIEFGERTGVSTLNIEGFDATADGLGIGYKIYAGNGVAVPASTVILADTRNYAINASTNFSYTASLSSTTIADTYSVGPLNVTLGPDIYTLNQSGTTTQVIGHNTTGAPVKSGFSVAISWGADDYQERTFQTYTDPNDIADVYIGRTKMSGGYTIVGSAIIFDVATAPTASQEVFFTKKSPLVSWDSELEVKSSLRDIDAAMATLRTESARLSSTLSIASTRLDYIQTMHALLVTGAENLTLADINTESATLLMLQVRQRTAISSLQLTSQTQASVMRLFLT